jgi:hypothetical protein
MSYRYDWYYDRESNYDYGEDYNCGEGREDINDGIDELVHREGEFIENFPTMSHAERLKKLERWPEYASLVQEDLTGDEGFELLLTAIKHGASLDAFSEEVHTRFTPEQYYEMWEAAVDGTPFELTSSATRFIPADKYRELYRFAMLKRVKVYSYACGWKLLYKHQSTITSVISDEEHCQIMTEFFLSYPEELHSFSHELDTPLLEDYECLGKKEEEKRFRICKEVVTIRPSALEWIWNGSTDNTLGSTWCFSDEQFKELEECAEQGPAFTNVAPQAATSAA